jgi:hypothetical protein
MNSKNLEIILKKAAVDEEFARRLILERSKLMDEHELELDEVERSMLDTLPEKQLRQMIRLTPVTSHERSLLKASVITVGLGVLIATGMVLSAGTVSSLGIRPDGIHSTISATKSKMSSLKTAFLCLNADMPGVFSVSDQFSEEGIKEYNERFFAPAQANFLINPDFPGVDKLFPHLDPESAKELIKKRWKGPYMDGQPEDFMLGAEGKRILIAFDNNHLYLHHPGPDSIYDDVAMAADSSSYHGDDLLLRLWKTRMRSENMPEAVNEGR